MPSIEAELRKRVETFAAELAELVRASALEFVQEALANGAAPARRARQPGAMTAASRRSAARARGEKRSSDEIAMLTDRLGRFIAKNPGKRIEEIAKELGTTTKELFLPVRKVIEGKRIATKGERRATRYFSK